MAEHTKMTVGPSLLAHKDGYWAAALFEDGQHVAEVHGKPSYAAQQRAQRLAACWNVCIGVDNPVVDHAARRDLILWVQANVPQIDHPSDPSRAVLRTILKRLG